MGVFISRYTAGDRYIKEQDGKVCYNWDKQIEALLLFF